jgi:4-hydroxy-3-methylbut-2-enyl diphosphate reductase
MTSSAPNRFGGALVCTALGVEARTVRRGWPDADIVRIGMRATKLERVHAHRGTVVLLGFGGGLDAGQRPGDVVVAAEIRDKDGRVALACAPQALTALHRAGVPATRGALWCSDAIVRGAHRKGLAASAVAVDMESAPVARACSADRLVVVRVIVDTPGMGLVRASVFGGRRAKRVLRDVAAAFATAARPTTTESITSGTVETAACSNTRSSNTRSSDTSKEG